MRSWGLVLAVPYGVKCRDVPWNVSTEGGAKSPSIWKGARRLVLNAAYGKTVVEVGREPHHVGTVIV